MSDHHSKEADYQEEGMSYMRTLSIARPSFQYDVLTDDDTQHGYIQKQSPSFLKRWQRRFFVLERKMIKYYKTEADYENKKPPKGILNLQQIWIEPVFKD